MSPQNEFSCDSVRGGRPESMRCVPPRSLGNTQVETLTTCSTAAVVGLPASVITSGLGFMALYRILFI